MSDSNQTVHNNGTIFAPAGFVIIGDIVGFSKLPADDQEALVKHLWEFINSDQLLADENNHYPQLNGTGDGALVAFPRSTGDGYPEPVSHEDALAFAKRWVSHMKSGKKDDQGEWVVPRASLRVGIHQGEFQVIDVAELGGRAEFGGRQVVGIAPNVCSRVAGLGDDNDIMVSEDFVTPWINKTGVKPGILDPEPVDPKDPNSKIPPIEAVVKHGFPLQVRRCKSATDLPKRIKLTHYVGEHIFVLLGQMEEYLLRSVAHQSIGPGFSNTDLRGIRKQLDPRLTVWVRGPGNKFAIPTDYRIMPSHLGDITPIKSKVRYRIRGAGQGATGQAIARNQVVGGTNIPTDLQGHKDYMKTAFNLPKSMVDEMSRRPGTLLQVPFRLMDGEGADGAVCIDTIEPIESLSDLELIAIGVQLRDIYARALAALWRLRLN